METACHGAITWLRLGRRLRRRYMITALLGHFRPLVVRFEPRAVVLGFVLWVFEILFYSDGDHNPPWLLPFR